MLKIFSYVILLLAVFLQLGCRQEFDDVSAEAQFSHLIGVQYEALVSLRVQGITTDSNYSPVVDFYYLSVTPEVEHKGPEVVVTSTFPVGEKLKVIKVLKCKNCFFSSSVDIAVAMESEKIESGKAILVAHELIGLKEGRIALKSTFFKELSIKTEMESIKGSELLIRH